MLTHNTEESKKDHMKYHCYDFDDNIFHMETVIHMEKKVGENWVEVDVSTSEFAKVRNDKENYRVIPTSFSDFRDDGPKGDRAFLEDTLFSIKNKNYGPSYDAFIGCLVDASIFAIITARGHSSNTIKNVVRYIIDNLLNKEQQFVMYNNCLKFAYLFHEKKHELSKYQRIPKEKVFSDNLLINDYLDECEYFGVSSPEFIEKFNMGDAAHPEIGKVEALKYFAGKIHVYGKKVGRCVKMGFSDDDKKTIDHITTMFSNELALMYPIELSVIDTSDRTIVGGKKIKI